MRGRPRRAGSVVLFLADERWDCFEQLAAGLRRRGFRPIRVVKQTRRGWLTRLADRAAYCEVVQLGEPGGVERLAALVESGAVVDVQVDERTLDRAGFGSPVADLVARASGVDHRTRAGWIDKAALARRLRLAGVRVPDSLPARCVSASDAAAILGLPLFVKRRVGTGGSEVVLAHEVAAVDRAARTLADDRSQVMYQQRIEGHVVGYGAVIGPESIEQEFTARESKSAGNRFGPTAQVLTVDDPELLATGRKVVQVLAYRGLASVEFVCDADRRLWYIDSGARVWGNFLSFINAGLDFCEGYARVLDPSSAVPGARRPRNGAELRVFPAALRDEVSHAPIASVLAGLTRDVCPLVRRLGAAYCSVAALGVAIDLDRQRRPPNLRRRALLASLRGVRQEPQLVTGART